MDGGIAGTGPANMQDSLPRSDVAAGSRASGATHAAVAGLVEDQIATSLLNLANPQIGQLLDHMEQARLSLDPLVLDALLRQAIAASDSHDLAAAMAAISELVALDPERGTQLVREAVPLAKIRGEVNDLLQRLELGAKAEAERTLAAATQAMASAARTDGPAASLYSQIIALSQRFLDAGQHINFVRAAELGEVVLAYYPEVAMDRNAPGSRGKRASGQRPPMPWRRTLVMLGWVSLGFLVIFVVQLLLSRR